MQTPKSHGPTPAPRREADEAPGPRPSAEPRSFAETPALQRRAVAPPAVEAPRGTVLKLAYFVHDLTDPSVRRRVRMLHAGGAETVVLGFRRALAAPGSIEGAPVIDLGQTYDGRLCHRAKATAMAALGSARWRSLLDGCDAVMARSLEMLAVASAARAACGLGGPLVYECLDIHRMMVGEGLESRAMRALERALLRHSDLLIVSSPAFLERYFAARQGLAEAARTRALLVENKVLELGAPPIPAASPVATPALRPLGPPWRIGWLGAIRCRKSLDMLKALAERRPDLVDVSLFGRPAYREFDDFDAQVARLPNLRFGGAYAAEDLPRLYGEVHFAWAIDYMEEGLNSSWLLPNRLYEASRFGAIPIALAEVNTGRFLARRGYGVRLADPDGLEDFFARLTPAGYARMQRELEAQPADAFVSRDADCRALVDAIAACRSGMRTRPAHLGRSSEAGASGPAARHAAFWRPPDAQLN